MSAQANEWTEGGDGASAVAQVVTRVSGSEAAVLFAPFWGLSPNSNRWSEFEFALSQNEENKPLFDGEDVRIAINKGWLVAEKHDAPGFVMDDHEEGGQLELVWRYHPVPAWQTILLHRQRAGAVIQ